MTLATVSFSLPAMACRVSHMTGVAGQTVAGTMSVEQGKTCMIRQFTNMRDAIGSRRFPTTDIDLMSGGSKGNVSVSGNRVVYAARAGARGTDSFSYRTRIKSGKEFRYRVAVEIY